MTHAHPIYDTDKRVVIDAATKNIAISDKDKPVLIQYDNYSEVITFEVDRFVEGHDLSLSTKVEVHYNNIDAAGRRASKGLYVADDLKIDPDNPAKVLVSWFISEQATKHEGTLNFVLSFSCLEDDVYNVYRWNSHIGTFVVSAGINNTEYLEQNYADVLEMWKETLFGIGDTEEARMLALSQQQRDTISERADYAISRVEEKGKVVLETIPPEYAAVLNDVNSIDSELKVLVDATLNKDTFGSIENVTATIVAAKFLDINGVPTTAADTTICVTEPISVSPEDVYLITGYNYSDNPTYAFYDISGNMVGRNNEYNLGGSTYHYDFVAIAPKTASTMRVNGNGYNPPKVKRVCSFAKPIHKYIEKVVESLITGSNIALETVDLTENKAYYLSKGVVTYLESNDQAFIVTDPIPVSEGEIYYARCGAYIDCDAYAFYNEHGVMIDNRVDSENTYSSFEGYLLVPRNATSLRLSTAGTLGPISLSKMVAVKDVHRWSGKKWVAMGDSLTEKNLRATKNYHDYIAEETGITVVNMGLSGTGYLRTHDEGNAFYQRVTSIPTDADVITIFGSGNDLSAGEIGDVMDTGTDTLCGAINTTLDNLFAFMPLAKVGVVTPCPWGYYKPGNDNKMELYSKAIVKICADRGIPCLDLYHCSGLRPWESSYLELAYSRDDGNNVHPDETGHAILAPKFKAFLETLIM